MIKQMNYFKLKSTRLRLGKTQADMAELLEIEQPSYSRKENGERPFTVEEAGKIAKFLGVKAGKLFFGQ